ATEPSPADPSSGVSTDVTLSWTPGRGVATHNVYFSTSRQAVVDGTVAPVPVAAGGACQDRASYGPLSLDLDETYYWKVNEVDDAATVTTWEGDLWSFTTIDRLTVDDMESYTPWDVEGDNIFEVWLDGPGDCVGPGNGTGSIVSLQEGSPAQGAKPMRYEYDNDGWVRNPCNSNIEESRDKYSVAEAIVADLPSGIGADWTAGGAAALSIWFQGTTDSDAEPLWVRLTDAATGADDTVAYGMYDGENPNDVNDGEWHEWLIDLGDFTLVDVTNVKSIAIGVGTEGSAEPGGSGTLYLDEIGLYAPRCVLTERSADFAVLDFAPVGNPRGDCVVDFLEIETITNQWLSSGLLVTPTAPNLSGLIVHYEFEGTANDSAGINHGTETGFPTYGPGKLGQAVVLDGVDDYIWVGGDFLLPEYSATLWFRADGGTGERDIFSAYDSAGAHGILLELRSNGTLRYLHRFPFGTGGGADIYSPGAYDDGAWYHAGIVKSAETMTLYVNGERVGSAAGAAQFDQALQNITMGVLKHDNLARYFTGPIDDVYLYDRALSQEEVASLAGRTEPFSEPFDLNADGSVDLKDFAALAADEWLDKQLWPRP
ncbi:MAG: LamG domain-containing protein, partial [Phycisphaerae bacterium]|nr:LamG domain-containing protein [Phycisphaerae bacterium]